LAKKCGEVVGVRPHWIVDVGLDVFVGRRESSAIGDPAMGLRKEGQLRFPGSQVAQTSMNEDDRVALAFPTVGERGSIDLACPVGEGRGTRHLARKARPSVDGMHQQGSYQIGEVTARS
jgi:hypothetical protein